MESQKLSKTNESEEKVVLNTTTLINSQIAKVCFLRIS